MRWQGSAWRTGRQPERFEVVGAGWKRLLALGWAEPCPGALVSGDAAIDRCRNWAYKTHLTHARPYTWKLWYDGI